MRSLRRAAAALLALALLAGALPASAVYVPKIGGGTKSSAATPDGTTPPHGHPGAAGAGGRVPHPPLLRAAAAAEGPEGRAQATEEQQAQAAREQAEHARPWAAAPHMRVRLTGDPVADAALLRSLNAELATRIDPDRVRVGSLADDALADDTLARLQPRAPDATQKQLWRYLRDPSQHLDLYHLTQALRPLQGDTLLVMAHVDASDGSLVFKAANGRPQRLPAALFEQAARDAGVQLVVVGCRSARHTSAGFADDLNAADAARAMARAAQARPSTLFDLFSALSSPQMVMEFDAVTFGATHTVEVTAGAGGAVLSTVHWSGPQAQAAARAASAGWEDPPRAAAAPLPSAWWAQAALPWVAGAALLSLLAGVVASRGLARRGGSVARRAGIDLLCHLLLVPFVLTMLAESVAGANGHWWAWVGGPLLLLAAALFVVIAWSGAEARDDRAWWLLQAARALTVSLPLLAVALLHTGWLVWPAPVMQALLALYGLGRPLPGPWGLLLGACVVYWLAGIALSGLDGVRGLSDARRARAGRLALWREQLAADGVSGAAARAALSARQAFEGRCLSPVAWVVRWDEAKTLTDGHAPDPWAGQPQRHWRLVAVPLLPPGQGVEPEVAFGLLRVGSPFMHALPPVLLQRWRDQDLRAADLPVLLAQVEPHLLWTDFLPPARVPRLRVLIVFGGALSALFAGLALTMDAGSAERSFCAGTAALLLALLVVWPGVVSARRRWHQRWLQRVRPKAMPANAQPPTAAAAG